MSGDRITELYEQQIGTSHSQARARARVHWMCERVVGDDVLDIGCSQGITSILLGREGKTVVGTDVDSAAIEFARERLAREERSTQDRVELRLVDGGPMDIPDASFDSVLLGEVIEHLLYPERVLSDAVRVLRPGGRLVLTVPFGLFPYPDHKEPVYLRYLLGLLMGLGLRPVEIELIDAYLAVTAEPGEADSESSVWIRALEVTEQRLANRDSAAEDRKTSQRRQSQTISELRAENDSLKLEVAELRGRLDVYAERGGRRVHPGRALRRALGGTGSGEGH